MKKKLLLLAILAGSLFNLSEAQNNVKPRFNDETGQTITVLAFEETGEAILSGFGDQTLTAYSDSALKKKISPADLEKLYYYYETVQLINPANPNDPYDLFDTMIYTCYHQGQWTFRQTVNGALAIRINPEQSHIVYLKAADIKKRISVLSYAAFSFILGRQSEFILTEEAGEKGFNAFNAIQEKIFYAAKTGVLKVYSNDSLRSLRPSWNELMEMAGHHSKVSVFDESGNVILADSTVITPLDAADVSGISTGGFFSQKNGVSTLKINALSLTFNILIAGVQLNDIALFSLDMKEVNKLLTNDENLFLQCLLEKGIIMKLEQEPIH